MTGDFLITKEFLKELSPCTDGYKWFCETYPGGGKYQEILDRLCEIDRFDDACWLLENIGATDDVLELDSMDDKEKDICFAGAVIVRKNLVLRHIRTGMSIDVGGDIDAGRSIKSGLHIDAGGSIKADWSIDADGHIDAGGNIKSGWSIDAGRSIKSGGRIETGRHLKSGMYINAGKRIDVGWSIDAGGSIKAGGTIKAGGFIDAGMSIKAGKPRSVCGGKGAIVSTARIRFY